MLAENPSETSLAQELRNKLIEDYTSSVFRDTIYPDPPVRGPYGYGRIDLVPGAVPVHTPEIRLSGVRREAMIELVKEWDAEKLVEPAMPSGWSSPAFPVPKKVPGKWRGVVSITAPNAATQNDSYPLPRIDDILERQGRRAMWSVVDLKSAYHQVPLLPEHRPITTTSTPLGTRQWRVLVMGLKNAPPQFQ